MADGALTDEQIRTLAKKMRLELAFVDFKSDLLTQPLEHAILTHLAVRRPQK